MAHFVSTAGGTFETAMPGTFVSAVGGTFENVMGGTIKHCHQFNYKKQQKSRK